MSNFQATHHHTALKSAAIESDLDHFIRKLQQAGAPESSIITFSDFYRGFRVGKRGLIPESAITPLPPHEIRYLKDLLEYHHSGEKALPHTVVIKLNGGLGTTMGCSGPKSMIPVKNGLNFLDITIRQLSEYSKEKELIPPLVLMNSFNTENQTSEALQKYLGQIDPHPKTFLQNRFPRIDSETLLPVSWPKATHREWNPAGHGDIFSALYSSGILEELLNQNYRYAFISNIDNLGASIDTALLGYMASENLQFLMEVTGRTSMDWKGGHIARTSSGCLILRESVQCPEDDLRYFQDIYRHRFFNTNNLWIDIAALDSILNRSGGTIQLPMLCNRKFLDSADPDSPVVYQLESAMGSALSSFPKSDAICVPRSRFIPVKSCNDLFLLRSDFYILDEKFKIITDTGSVRTTPQVVLDSRYFGTVDQLNTRFAHGVPSLRNCRKVTVEGDVFFGKDVTISGDVTISNYGRQPFLIGDNSEIISNLQI